MISMYNDSRIRILKSIKERERHRKKMKKEVRRVKKVKRKEIRSIEKQGHRIQT